MATVKELLEMLNLDEYIHVIVVDARRRYYLGGGKQSDMLRRFGDKPVCSTGILESKLMFYVE